MRKLRKAYLECRGEGELAEALGAGDLAVEFGFDVVDGGSASFDFGEFENGSEADTGNPRGLGEARKPQAGAKEEVGDLLDVVANRPPPCSRGRSFRLWSRWRMSC